MCFVMFELVDTERKILRMFLRCFAQEISGENPEFSCLKTVRLTMRLRTWTHARRMALQGHFSIIEKPYVLVSEMQP